MLLRLGLTFLFLTAVPGMADGIFKLPLGAVKPVDIPGQTAVISYQDGKETLTVWNTVQAEGQELAWVLPLPAQPDIIQETSPAALRLLQVMSAPVVRTGYSRGNEVLILVAGLCLGALLLLCPRPQRLSAGLAWVGGSGVFIFISYLFVPYYTTTFRGSGGSGPVAGVQVLTKQETGNYEITIVSGDAAEAVNNWLAAGKFPAFAGEELKVVEDYIAKKWVFLCAKLKTGVSGPAATHPVTVRFASAQPVYPMRLTAGAGTVPVELFVLGEKPAADAGGRLAPAQIVNADTLPHRGLKRDYTNTAAVIGLSQALPPGAARDDFLARNKIPLIPRGQEPLLDSLLHGDPWITHLKGTFSPGGDWSDIAIEWTESDMSTRLPHYVTRQALIDKAVERYGVWTVVIFMAFGAVAHFSARPGKRPHRRWPLTAAAMLAGITIAAWWNVKGDAVIVESSQLVRLSADDEDPDAPRNLLRRWLEFDAARNATATNSQ